MDDSHAETETRSLSRPVGLCLSGGGSRAMAFHLGCLCALHDRGVLPKVDVVSTVSGGSVIGAIYAYSDDSFQEFVARVRETLRRGFVKGIARRLLLSPLLFHVIGTHLVAGSAAYGTFALRNGFGLIERLVPKRSRAVATWSSRLQPPLRRWVSRTSAFEKTLADLLYTTNLKFPHSQSPDSRIAAWNQGFFVYQGESGGWGVGM